jgi:hypothetical protein
MNLPPGENDGELDIPPLWVRAVLGVSRSSAFGAGVVMLFCEEFLCARVPPAARDRLTSLMYASQTAFLKGGTDFNAGLHDWEERIVGGPLFPRKGRILLGAAGGGREMLPLAERGYDLVVFEPSKLFLGARAVAAPFANVQVVRASYADLVRAVEARTGPLAEAVSNNFDAVILGWGSLSHVTAAEDRTALFRAIRRIAPKAPVVFSFFRPPRARAGRLERLRRPVQWLLRPLGSEVGSRLRFSLTFGFVRPLELDDLTALAASTDYHLLQAESVQWGNGVFLPRRLAG